MTETEAHDVTVFACSLWPWVAKWTPERLRALRDGFRFIQGVGVDQARAALSELYRTTDKTPQPRALLAAIRGCKPVVATAPAARTKPVADSAERLPMSEAWPKLLQSLADGSISHDRASDPNTTIGCAVAAFRAGELIGMAEAMRRTSPKRSVSRLAAGAVA